MGNETSTHGVPCSSSERRCTAKELVCSETFGHGKCICRPGWRFIENRCRSVWCTVDEECHRIWGPHSKCTDSPRQCACSAQVINGNPRFVFEGGRCSVAKYSGDGCNSDNEGSRSMGKSAYCHVGHADPGYTGSCQCKETHTWDIGRRACLENNHCLVTNECNIPIEVTTDAATIFPSCNYFTGQCVCLDKTTNSPTDMIFVNEFNKCYNKRVYNQTCEGDEECKASLGPDVECRNWEGRSDPKVCQCPMGSIVSANNSETYITNCIPGEGVGSPEFLPGDTGNDTMGSEAVSMMLVSSFAIAGILILFAVGVYITLRCLRKRKHHVTKEVEMEMPISPDPPRQDISYETICMNLSIPVYSREKITLLKKVGQGCFGAVFKGVLDGKVVAVKMFPTGQLTDAIQEIETMASFSHPHILSLMGVVKLDDAEPPGLLLEFMEHGDLIGVLRSDNFKPNSGQYIPAATNVSENLLQPTFHLTQITLHRISWQIAQGMKYLSNHHFIHRDLAARNCLVDAAGNVKVSDFGLSKDIYSNDYYRFGGMKPLPVRWMSPESLIYGRFTLESDVWAYGVLLWEIYILGLQPYYGHSNDEVIELIKKHVLLEQPDECPDFIHGIMTGCWMTQPNDRMTFSQICKRFESIDRDIQRGTTDCVHIIPYAEYLDFV